jgi:hypothetical protein
MLPLHELYSQHAALSLEKQLALGEIIGNRDFSFDATAGQLGFGDDLAFPMQVLGSVSRQSSTWLWAWASPQPLPEPLLQAAEQLKAVGKAQGIGELYEEGFDIISPPAPVESLLDMHQRLTNVGHAQEPLDGHLIAMLAAGVCQADAYYGADYGRGIAYVLLPQVPGTEAHRSDAPAAMAAIFAELLQLPYLLDHRAAFGAYVQQKGYVAEANGRQVRGIKGHQVITATFDSANRLTALEADGTPVAV